MIQSISRKEALSFLEYFRRGWETGGWSDSEHYFAKGMSLRSSHKGMINGLEAVISAFAKDTESGSALNLVTSNYYAADDGQGLAMVSAYLYGEICPTVRYNPSAMFGAVVRVTLKIEANAWKIAELLVNISWAEGSTRYFPDWKLPPGEKGWRPGDAPLFSSVNLTLPGPVFLKIKLNRQK